MVRIDNFKYNNILPQIDTSWMDRASKEIAKSNQEKRTMELENNENLKQLVSYDEQLVEFNKQLVDYNKVMLNKINIISDSMDTVINSIGANAQRLEKNSMEHNKLLLELIEIMESKDEEEKNKLGDFLKGLTGNVAAGLIVEYFKFKLKFT